MGARRELYSKVVIEEVPRLLSLLDRDEESITYGCFDRWYWQYKVIDFPCARFQEACLTLSLLYKNEYPGNLYRHNKKIRDWAFASMEFWSKIQNRDGSFNEAYPNEHSFVATAFSTYAISESLILLEGRKEYNEVFEGLIKAADWLTRNDEILATNQEAGAVAALYNVYKLTGEKEYLEDIERKLEIISDNQSEEGWFYEYGGPDFGYLSLGIDYLAKYYHRSHDERVTDLLKKSVSFLTNFIHPNGTIGGQYGSRNTEYLIPHGFEIFGRKFPLALAISDIFLKSLATGNGISPATLDDRYFVYNGYSYLQAYDDYALREEEAKLPTGPINVFFPDSKLLVRRTETYQTIVGAAKGGVLKIYDLKTNKHFYSDSGFFGILANGKEVTTQWLDSDIEVVNSEERIKINGNFFLVSSKRLSPLKTIALRGSGLCLGWSSTFARGIKKYLRGLLIRNAKKLPIEFEREIIFKEDHITVLDRVLSKEKFDALYLGENFTPIHVSSSKYFLLQDLEQQEDGHKRDYSKDFVDNCLSVIRTFYPAQRKVVIEV
jgi:hypothetical protein